jgi:hypothetical protein
MKRTFSLVLAAVMTMFVAAPLATMGAPPTKKISIVDYNYNHQQAPAIEQASAEVESPPGNLATPGDQFARVVAEAEVPLRACLTSRPASSTGPPLKYVVTNRRWHAGKERAAVNTDRNNSSTAQIEMKLAEPAAQTWLTARLN